MRLAITGLAEFRARLAQIRPDETMAQALVEHAERLAEAVRANLCAPPQGGDHATPWVQTGALRDSIGCTADGLEAVIGSNDPAAAPQEMGTSRIPPRPFLATVAAALGETVAQAVGSTLAAALRSETEPSI